MRRPGAASLGVELRGFDPRQATDEDIELLRKTIYHDKVVVLRQQDLTAAEYLALAGRLGEVVPYYEPIYHHPEHPEIFVSSNVELDGRRVGVPKTGQFWHSDYQFTRTPFAFTLFYPQALPPGNRCTYFIDLTEAHDAVVDRLGDALRAREAVHSVRNYFKIRPEDVYRPIVEVLREVDQRTPPVRMPLVAVHPATGEQVLYFSEGFTIALDEGAPAGLLDTLLEETGQRDPTFSHPLVRRLDYELGDIAIWDNRSLIHRGLHTKGDEPAVSFRLTVVDDLPTFDPVAP